MNRPTAKCPTCGREDAPVEWRSFPYRDEWAYFFTLHSRPDNGMACQGIGSEAHGVREPREREFWNLPEHLPVVEP